MKTLILISLTLVPAMLVAQTIEIPNPDLPGGGFCEDDRPGCPSNPHIVECDSCSAAAMEAKALWAANREGDNYVYVVDRADRLVDLYWVYVTFTSNGVHKSIVPMGFDSQREQSIKAALEAASDVHNWLKSDATVTAEDLVTAGVPVPFDNAFDFAAASNGPVALSDAVSLYLNSDFDEMKTWGELVDQLTSIAISAISKIADLAVDASASIIFEWSDGSSIKLEIKVLVGADGDVEVVAEAVRITLRAANGDNIPFDLSGFGIGDGGGFSNPIYVGDPSAEDDLRRYLDHLGSLDGNTCTTTELSCDGSGVCIARISC